MKPIKLAADFKEQALAKFQEVLSSYQGGSALNFKMDPASVEAPKDAEGKVIKPEIQITATAYLKMRALILTTDKEIAWHGFVTRLAEYTFRITDIVCYPQKAAAATVESDDDEYIKFLMQLNNEQANTMRFQGHSHVKMGVSPSGRDTQNWDKFMSTLRADEYCIFCIMNKQAEETWRLFDLKTNRQFEHNDLTVSVVTDDGSLMFTQWAKETYTTNVKETKYITSYGAAINSNYSGYAGGTPTHASGQACWDDYGYPYKVPPKDQVVYDPDTDEYVSRDFRTGYRWDYARQAYVRPADNFTRLPSDTEQSKKSGKGGKGGKKK